MVIFDKVVDLKVLGSEVRFLLFKSSFFNWGRFCKMVVVLLLKLFLLICNCFNLVREESDEKLVVMML